MARRFKFHLQSLLRVREVAEDRARRRFFEVLRSTHALERELREIAREREDARARCRRPLEEGAALDLEEILRRQRYLNVLQGRMASRHQEILRLRPALEEARTALREARRRRKVVEEIRDRRKREFELEETRREVRELDEIGQVYHATAPDRSLIE
jgi:flagellar FliJ protein